MQWLLTAVVLGAACWMVFALTYQDDERAERGPPRLLEGGWAFIPRLAHGRLAPLRRWWEASRSALLRFVRVAGPPVAAAAKATATVTTRVLKITASVVWTAVRTVWIAIRTVAVTSGRGARFAGTIAVRGWNRTTGRIADLGRARRERPGRPRSDQRRAVPFEKSFILTGPGPEESAVGAALPTFNGSAKRPSALTRLSAFVQLLFLVVLWGSGAALAIAGAAWAVTRIV